MTTREEQAEHKSWLDSIIEYVPSGRVIPKQLGEVVIPLTPGQEQVQRMLTFCRLVKEGKLASAAHVQREWLKHNPWANGEMAAKFKEN